MPYDETSELRKRENKEATAKEVTESLNRRMGSRSEPLQEPQYVESFINSPASTRLTPREFEEYLSTASIFVKLREVDFSDPYIRVKMASLESVCRLRDKLLTNNRDASVYNGMIEKLITEISQRTNKIK